MAPEKESPSPSSRAQRALRRSGRSGDGPGSDGADAGSSGRRRRSPQRQRNQAVPSGSASSASRGKKKSPTAAKNPPRRRQQAQARAPIAPEHNNSNNNNSSNNNNILGAFYGMLLQGAPPQEGNPAGASAASAVDIDLQKASNVLEAAAGNLALAANLYWDDYFATQAAQGHARGHANPNAGRSNEGANPDGEGEDDRKPPAAMEDLARAGGDDDEDNNGDNSGEDDDRHPASSKRRLRRSLDPDFQAADDDEDTKRRKRAAKRARRSLEGENDRGGDGETRARPRRGRSRRRREEARGGEDHDANANAGGEDGGQAPPRVLAEASISVSDDELPVGPEAKPKPRLRLSPPSDYLFERRKYTWDPDRHKGKPPAPDPLGNPHAIFSYKELEEAAEAVQKQIDLETTFLSRPSAWFVGTDKEKKPRGKHKNHKNDESPADPDDYVSDDEWLQVNGKPLARDALWGVIPTEAEPAAEPEPNQNNDNDNGDNNEDNNHDNNNNGNDNDNDNNDINNNSNNNNNNDNNDDDNDVNLNRNLEGIGNVVAADLSGGEEDEDKDSGKDASLPTGIPFTWLKSGFRLSDCGTGLSIRSPRVEDIDFFTWRRKQDNHLRNAVPPPYHCKSLTAITSIVTALLYSGARIRGDGIACDKGRKPWTSLTPAERKRNFEPRLTDALSVLILVAARASRKRKQEAYEKATQSPEGGDPTDPAEYSELFREALVTRKLMLEEQARVKIEEERNVAYRAARRSGELAAARVIEDGDADPALVEDASPSKQEPPGAEAPGPKPEKKAPISRQERQRMRRRIDLVPTCVWANPTAASATRGGDEGPYNTRVRVRTTWTNLEDIRLYVSSNIKTFTENGGIALFLETIVRIHGNKVVARQLDRCASVQTSRLPAGKENAEPCPRKAEPLSPAAGMDTKETGATAVCSSTPSGGGRSLIRCTCEERSRKSNEENPMPLNLRIDPNNLLDTTPDGTGCASVELLNLLLTGRARPDWKDCSAGELGIGLLTSSAGEVGRAMSRPERPVWLVKGEASYSVLVIEGGWSRSGKESPGGAGPIPDTISRVDRPGMALGLLHWNGWYGQRGRTRMRLVAAEPPAEIPSRAVLEAKEKEQRLEQLPTPFPALRGKPHKGTASRLMEHRRYERLVDLVGEGEHESSRAVQNERPISRSELDRIEICREDEALYPNNHKMWRFAMGAADESATKEQEGLPPSSSTDRWTPYYRLSPRQKRLVEARLGPKIRGILWTRWPTAVVDHFSPSEGGFPVV